MITKGHLTAFFVAVAAKRLSAVEVDPARSHQHELNGVTELRKLLGSTRATIPAQFIWLGDEQEAVTDDGTLTWYDARENHPTRSEWRLYFPSNPVTEVAAAGDAIFLAKRTDRSVMLIVTPSGSTIEQQLLWLFALPDNIGPEFEPRPIDDKDPRLDFAVRTILDELGIEPEEPDTSHLDELLSSFSTFPTTREFSAAARASLADLDPIARPDDTLLAWMDREEQLFRRLERRIVAERLGAGFMAGDTADVDGFIYFSLSVQNRRKARAGSALENHLNQLFSVHQLRFARGAETENHNKPDFLFPGATEYHDPAFPSALLTMLGAKSTLKDRWRQVLAEAARIADKHLLTLEAGISENQTEQMRANHLHLVVPAPLHATYKPHQQNNLMSVAQFIALINERQAGARTS